jgi:hypothetical protein
MLKIALKLYRKHFNEAIKVIIFGFVSVITFIVGFSVYRAYDSEINRIADNLRIAVIVESDQSNNDIIVLKNKISNITGIKYSEYSDPEKNRDIFLSGNKINQNAIFLDSFPRLIFASLENDFFHSGKTSAIISMIHSIKGVNDIIYDKDAFTAFYKFRKVAIITIIVVSSVLLTLMIFYGLTLNNGQKRFYQKNFEILFRLGFSQAKAALPLTLYELICHLIGLALGLTVFLIIWFSLESYYYSIRNIIMGSVPVGLIMTFIFSSSMILISNIFFRTTGKK